MPGKIVTVAAVRGGSGKTSTASGLAHAAAADGKKVLLIDCDPQCSLTIWERGDPTQPGLFAVLADGESLSGVIQKTESGVDLVSGSADLMSLKAKPGSIATLWNALQSVRRKFDLIVTDTPPSLGELMNRAIYSGTYLLMSLDCDADSLQAMYTLHDIAEHVKAAGGHVRKMGAVVTKYDQRPKINRMYLDSMTEAGAQIGVPVVGVIRAGVAVREARAVREPLETYARRSKPAQDYRQLYESLQKQAVI